MGVLINPIEVSFYFKKNKWHKFEFNNKKNKMSNFLCIGKGSKVSLSNGTFRNIELIEIGNKV